MIKIKCVFRLSLPLSVHGRSEVRAATQHALCSGTYTDALAISLASWPGYTCPVQWFMWSKPHHTLCFLRKQEEVFLFGAEVTGGKDDEALCQTTSVNVLPPWLRAAVILPTTGLLKRENKKIRLINLSYNTWSTTEPSSKTFKVFEYLSKDIFIVKFSFVFIIKLQHVIEQHYVSNVDKNKNCKY